MASPLLAQARRSTVYYDWSKRRWTTTIVHGDMVTTERHISEAKARAHIALDGGSPDPSYTPPAGDNAAQAVLHAIPTPPDHAA